MYQTKTVDVNFFGPPVLGKMLLNTICRKHHFQSLFGLDYFQRWIRWFVSSTFHLFNLASAQVWMRQNDTQHSKLHRCKRLYRCNEVASMQTLNHRTFGLLWSQIFKVLSSISDMPNYPICWTASPLFRRATSSFFAPLGEFSFTQHEGSVRAADRARWKRQLPKDRF